ncbi:MAG: hypothetical protein ABEJ58_03630 [Halodesulfurarchaeum sp.]
MKSLAAVTRDAVDQQPFLRRALRAGVLNVAATARYLDVDGDPDSIATAIRRYGEELPPLGGTDRNVRVTMTRLENDLPVHIDGETFADGTRERRKLESETDTNDAAAIQATGEVGPRFLGTVLHRLATEDVPVIETAMQESILVVVVPRRHGATTVRVLEETASG